MAEAWAGGETRGGGSGRAASPRPPLAPLRLGVVVFLAILAFYLGSAFFFDVLGEVYAPGEPLGVNPDRRFELVLALLIAYTLAVGRLGRHRALRDLAELRPILRVSEAEYRELQERVAVPDRRRVALVCAAGAAFGIALVVVSQWLGAFDRLPSTGQGPLRFVWGFFRAWNTLLNGVLMALLARMAYLSLTVVRVFSELGRRRTQVRLLDPDSRAPFARAGLRQAVFWFVGSSIASLLVLEAVAPGLVLLVLVATLTLGVVSLVLPARGIRDALRRAKRRELAWVRGAIEAERSGLERDPSDAPAAGSRLPGLIAYEARIAGVGEWPFDAPMLLRFTLFLLLPLGSWVGGAMVERLLDVVLD